jgi:hypothetical protein
MNTLLLFLHFVGLVMGFAVSIGNLVMMRLIERATPQDAAVLRRFPPAMVRVGDIGLLLLLVTGPIMVQTKYDGAWGALPWSFWVKMAAVAALIALVGIAHVTSAQIRRGNFAAAARMKVVGPLAGLSAFTAVLFAVIAFN